MSSPGIIVGVIVFVLATFVILNYNTLVALQNHIKEAWGNVDTELKRRYDLIPNLVAAVKGYAAHEREVFEKVTLLRNQCLANTGSVSEQEKDEKKLVDAMRQFMVVVENYPALKADKNFLDLQEELVNTEDRIQAARRFFNGNVRDYRNKVEMFPSSIVASIFGFKLRDYFQVESVVRDAPSVGS